jgi:DDB1- and CUL4-associated factor 5
MLTGSDDWNIYVWKMPDQWPSDQQDEEDGAAGVIEKAHVVLKGHRSIVNHVKFGERSNLLISCGVEKIVKVFKINSKYN